MLSPTLVKVINVLPESLVVKITKVIVNKYFKKYANIKIEGFENIEKASGPKIFICNHLSNADGLILDKVLREKYDPTFVAGVKLSSDPVTRLGTAMIKNVGIKPNSADKEAITKIVKLVRGGENLVIFPEGTRSKTDDFNNAKAGLSLFATKAKAEIVPCTIYSSYKLFKPAKIYFGEPISLEEYYKQKLTSEDHERISGEVMDIIKQNYYKLEKGEI